MNKTIVEQLAEFSAGTSYERLPAKVIEECKRDLLDAIGCALGGVDQPKGRAGIACAQRMAGSADEAGIIGTALRSTTFGAAFANAELINTLDADSVLLPGHVSPYVLPGALAVAEALRRSGQDLIAAVAVSHEMSYRFGAAMSQNRDFQDGKVSTPAVLGYTSTVFGATASAAKLKGLPVGKIANALGIAGATTPVNSHRAWLMHAPPTTIKYVLAGGLAQTALTAAEMADLGHRGDLQTLDDREFGYPRFIGTTRWEPSAILSGLGSDWRFPQYQFYKPYPHCRVMGAPLDLLIDLIARHDIQVGEIESIKAYGEGWAYVLPSFVSRDIQRVEDAQFCFAHGLAVAAHRIEPGPKWQDPAVVFDPSVMALMDKVSLEVHTASVEALAQNPSSRPTRLEILARGQVFAGERRYPKGTPSPDPESHMSTDELVHKFRVNARDVLGPERIDRVLDQLLNLEKVDDFGTVMRLLVRQ